MSASTDAGMILADCGDVDAVIIAVRTSRLEIQFRVLTIVKRDADGVPLFARRGGELSSDLTASVADAAPLFIGEMDGDGCSQTHLGHDGALHLCDVADAARFGRILERAIGVARELLDADATMTWQ